MGIGVAIGVGIGLRIRCSCLFPLSYLSPPTPLHPPNRKTKGGQLFCVETAMLMHSLSTICYIHHSYMPKTKEANTNANANANANASDDAVCNFASVNAHQVQASGVR